MATGDDFPQDDLYDTWLDTLDKTCFKNPENPRCIDLFITKLLTVLAVFKTQQLW